MSDGNRTPHARENTEEPMNAPHPSGAPEDKRSFRSLLSGALAMLRREGMAFLLLGALLLIAAGTWYAIVRSPDGWVRSLAIGGLVAIAIYAVPSG